MNKSSFQGANPAKPLKNHILIQKTLSLMSGLGIISSQLFLAPVIASTETLVIPDTSAEKPEVVAPAPVKIPKSSPRVAPNPPALTKPDLQPASIKPSTPKVAPKPSVSNNSKETATPKVQLSAPKIVPPTSQTTSVAPLVPIQPKKTPINTVATQGKNSYIDPTNYGTTPNQKVIAPSAVILTERSTGCQTISQSGQLLTGSCGSVAQKQPTPQARPALASRRVNLASRQSQPAPTKMAISRTRYMAQVQPTQFKARPVSSQQVVSLQPIARKGLSISLEPVPRYNRAASLYSRIAPQQGGQTNLMYPLPVVANITSAFGWRIHPISWTSRRHEGTDIGAPMGTPVLASYAGEVSQADWLGGYGLTVILRHLEGTQESRYAHLSDIYVRPGEWIEQGTVIGRVGSTGNSTGPHLHFEWRHLTEEGWVAVDAGLHLEYALENLMRSVQMAEAVAKPEG
jgi:murein DD-endopeptidase MepM/ murein hydrolase activator NlpD